MADQRRRRRTDGQGGRRGQGPRPAGAARRARAALLGSAGDTAIRGAGEKTPDAPGPAKDRLRPRLTGRGAILVVVVAVLVVSYASSLKAYLQQRHDIKALQSEIVSRQRSIDQLQEQKDRWQDPAYVKQQARATFGYVMPGETSYVALDAQGHQIQAKSELGKPAKVGVSRTPTAWWDTAWGSVELAGNPPKQDTKGPATTIDGSKQGDQRQKE